LSLSLCFSTIPPSLCLSVTLFLISLPPSLCLSLSFLSPSVTLRHLVLSPSHSLSVCPSPSLSPSLLSLSLSLSSLSLPLCSLSLWWSRAQAVCVHVFWRSGCGGV